MWGKTYCGPKLPTFRAKHLQKQGDTGLVAMLKQIFTGKDFNIARQKSGADARGDSRKLSVDLGPEDQTKIGATQRPHNVQTPEMPLAALQGKGAACASVRSPVDQLAAAEHRTSMTKGCSSHVSSAEQGSTLFYMSTALCGC